MHLVIEIVAFLFLFLTISWIAVAVAILRGKERARSVAGGTIYRGGEAHMIQLPDEHISTTITKQDLQVLRRIAEKGYVDLSELQASFGEARSEIAKRLKKLERMGIVASKNDELYMAVDDVWKLLEKMREKYPYS